jgi:putative addiction module component (TIGR02574 family)
MSADQIVEEASQWPPQKLADLVDRLTLRLLDADEPNMNDAWKQEVRLRLADIESGRLEAVAGEEVSARIRQIVGR